MPHPKQTRGRSISRSCSSSPYTSCSSCSSREEEVHGRGGNARMKKEEVATLPRRGSIILAVKDKEAQEGELKETEKKAYCPNPSAAKR